MRETDAREGTNAAAHFWLTSHNPHVGSALCDFNLYARPRDISSLPVPHRGDKVFIYEQTYGEIDGKHASGGRGGIVPATEVVSDGWRDRKTSSDFTKEAVCAAGDPDGFVPLDAMGAPLGHAGRFPIFGLNGGRGLMTMTEQQYEELFSIFKSNPRR